MSEVKLNYLVLHGSAPLLYVAAGTQVWALEQENSNSPYLWVQGKKITPGNQNRLIQLFRIMNPSEKKTVGGFHPHNSISNFLQFRLRHLPPEVRRRGGNLYCVLGEVPSSNPEYVTLGMYWDTRRLHTPFDEMPLRGYQGPYPKTIQMPRIHLPLVPENELDDWILCEVYRASRGNGITTYAIARRILGDEVSGAEYECISKRLDWLHNHDFIWTDDKPHGTDIWMITP